jgi:acyl-CoA synthetase (AMP-forming)/AMP-acid ligase II
VDEEAVAFVVLRQRVALDQLCLANMGRCKRPRKYFFVSKLPTNSSGNFPRS